MKSRFLTILTLLIVIIFGFNQSAKADPNPNSSNGLPCTTGSNYRSRMTGPWDPDRFDAHPDIRYSPRWDIFYYAQCMDPATSGVLQTVLTKVIADGKIDKPGCNKGKNITFDNNGDLKLCGEEDDSYVGIRGTGSAATWVVGYYSNSPGNDESLLGDVQAARSKYGEKISHEQAAKILDTVAWNHKADGWGVLSKPAGNKCPISSSVFISCDYLFNKNSGNVYDVFSDAPGPCTLATGETISVTSKAAPVWRADGTLPLDRWVSPVDPSGVSDKLGDDIELEDNSVCIADESESGDEEDDGSVIPPDLSSEGVVAMTGKNPSVAFNPNNESWLVVAENGGKIQGQLMIGKNKLSGKLLNIGGSNAHTPKIGYSQGSDKYLVVWTAGQDPTAILWGQFVSDDGSNSGSSFQIASGGAHLYSPGDIQYDPGSQSFVFVYEKAAAGTSVMLVKVSDSGTVTAPVKVADVGSRKSTPSLAVNLSESEYCTIYSDKDSIKVTSISKAGAVGTASELTKAQAAIGIIYRKSPENNYTVSWLDSTGKVNLKTISKCFDDADSDADSLEDSTQTGILIQGNNGFGLFTVNKGGTKDEFTSFDSAGNSPAGQTIFAGTWNTEGFWLSAAPNTVLGTYAAVASPDSKTVKFVSGIGRPLAATIDNGFPPSNNLPVPSRGLPTDFGQLVSAIFNWSLGLIGLVIFTRFFYAGFLWFTAAGNSSKSGQARTIMKNAVYGTLILFSAYLILNSINPDLVGGTLNLPGLPGAGPSTPSTSGAPPVSATCNNTNALAQKYNEPTTTQNDPKLNDLLAKIKAKFPPSFDYGEISTFDKSHPVCNVTRGNTECGTCSHTVNSCHYGGKTGTQGSLAVDFGNEKNGDQIIQAALSLGVPSIKARCEDNQGKRVECSSPTATHVHISEASCVGN